MSVPIPGYSFEHLLFQGHATSVYRGVRERDGAPVVAKVLAVEYPSVQQLAQLRHEYGVLASLDIEGVVKAYSLEEFNNTLAIIMEDFGAVSLKAHLSANSIGLEEKLKIAGKLSRILGSLHSSKILHKDINPSNIVINPQTGVVKFIDFENATYLSHEDSQSASPEQLEGTLAYISPEQTGRMNRPVDYRSDYYSLGVTLYEMLAGRLPFESGDGMAMIHMHMAVPPPRLHEQDPAIPKAVSGIVQKLMEKNAENRYQSAVGIAKDLAVCIEALLNGQSLDGFAAGAFDIPDRFSIPSKLYGRERETAALLEVYQKVCAGGSGMAMVAGYSGIGKSMLINEIHKPIARHRGGGIAGKYDQYRRNVPYSAFIQAFQDLLRQILTESDERIAFWRGRLLDALGGNGQVLIDVLPELAWVMGGQPEVPALAPQEAQNRFMLCFRNFVQVFAQAEHPLAIFLDDLQWADNPSLNLIEMLGADAGCQYLLIIGAYRENEVDASHPLQLALSRLRGQKVAVTEIALGKLPPAVVRQIVGDTFNRQDEGARALADLVYRKTDGNPFFVNQLLKNLHDNGLVYYDHAENAWRWETGEIERVGMTDNVVELMAGNIKKLPQAAQEVLKLAACMGNVFSLRDLAVAAEAGGNAIAKKLHDALLAGLVVPLGDGYKFVGETGDGELGGVRYRFLHDRVQQAAYDLLSREEKAETHLKVGRLLLRDAQGQPPDEKLFGIVGHFNQAFDLVSDAPTRLRLAELNCKAAVKAKDSIAYEPALSFANMARAYLQGVDSPPRAFAFKLRRTLAECEYLNGHREAAGKLYREALEMAGDDAERIVVYEAMIHFHTNFGDFHSAYQTGREALRLFGLSAPAKFIPPLFVLDLLRAKWLMRGKKATDLAGLPLCRDDNWRAAMRLIAAFSKAAYQIQPELCVANAVKAVILCLRHGAMEDIAVPFAVVGCIFLGGVMGDHRQGYEFGQLALAMNQRFDNLKQRSEVNFVTAYFADFWLRPARDTESFYLKAYETGLQTGDFFHLSCAACTLVESQFIRGVALPEVKRLGEGYLGFMERIKSQEAGGAIRAVLRAVANLEGATDSPGSFGGEDFDEAGFVQRLRGFTSLHFAHFYFVNKMQALYLRGLYQEALAMARESEQFLKHSIAMLHTVEHHFYHGMILCAVYGLTGQRPLLAKARKIHKRLAGWARLNPANFEHKALLLQAELESPNLGGWRAGRLYSEAANSAEKHKFPHIKALACERAGRFFARAGDGIAAGAYLREAFHGYQNWGAAALAERLAGDFPRAFYRLPAGNAENEAAPPPPRTLSTLTSARSKAWLDLDTVVKATHAISSEIHLAALLEKMMAIIIENAGAERGCFIRSEQDKFLLEAEVGLQESEVSVLGGLAVDGARAPLSLLHYVSRTGESVVLDDAQSNNRFEADPYIAGRRPRSVLCAPIFHHGLVIAMVYLENNLSAGVFTGERLKLIHILAAQAAISLENSLLYANLEQRVQQRTQELALATEKLLEANKQLERLSYTDGLTGVSNKRHFQEVYEREWKRASRGESPLAVMLIDIDCFKLFNDTYGHMDGDRCLKAVAGALRSQLYREGDFIARFGGEEFAILLPGSNADDAQLVAGRLVQSVRDLGMVHETSLAADIVTISLGIAVAVPRPEGDPHSLIKAADDALYRAKTGGRNRFTL